MRVVIQRVSNATVRVEGKAVGQISKGLLVYLGVENGDTEDDMKFIADKIVNLRVFSDDQGKMNLSTLNVSSEVLIVSQFTLLGDCRKGRRPGFDLSAEPKVAEILYEKTIEAVKAYGVKVQTGMFRAHMYIESVNDGPVTFLLDSKKLF
ncbi:MAG: D-tyrosyl-tRNA(Tyr) deacylase [Phycisphaerae bacterium]|nr:D-tyrosyl-tRNA(Tyr) deacylase [Phycisphaerae bacterium]